jgi:hypothetical protein
MAYVVAYAELALGLGLIAGFLTPAALIGGLLLNAAHHYPREFCPHCWSEEVTWEEAAGRATLYTWSAVHLNDLPPFTGRTPCLAAVVDLAEGPRMMTEPVDCPPDAVRAGMPLTVTFRDGIPVFRPAESPS